MSHDDVIKWKHFPYYWPFVRGIHRSPVDSPLKCQWCRALMYSLIRARRKGWANNWDAGDLKCHRPHYDIIVMKCTKFRFTCTIHPSWWGIYILLQGLNIMISQATSDESTSWIDTWYGHFWQWSERFLCWAATYSAQVTKIVVPKSECM